jgi:hypothetical protein
MLLREETGGIGGGAISWLERVSNGLQSRRLWTANFVGRFGFGLDRGWDPYVIRCPRSLIRTVRLTVHVRNLQSIRHPLGSQPKASRTATTPVHLLQKIPKIHFQPLRTIYIGPRPSNSTADVIQPSREGNLWPLCHERCQQLT